VSCASSSSNCESSSASAAQKPLTHCSPHSSSNPTINSTKPYPDHTAHQCLIYRRLHVFEHLLASLSKHRLRRQSATSTVWVFGSHRIDMHPHRTGTITFWLDCPSVPSIHLKSHPQAKIHLHRKHSTGQAYLRPCLGFHSRWLGDFTLTFLTFCLHSIVWRCKFIFRAP